jgi:hypothetical protein
MSITYTVEKIEGVTNPFRVLQTTDNGSRVIGHFVSDEAARKEIARFEVDRVRRERREKILAGGDD